MRTIALVATSLAALAASPAAAVQGDGPVRSIVGERAHRLESPAVQRQHAKGAAWQDFLARRGGQWTARFDDATGTPVRFYGSGWDVDAARLATDKGAFAIARDILRDEIALLGPGVTVEDLEPLVVDRTDGIVTVTFQQRWRGVRVDETRLSLRFKFDRFVMGQVETLPAPTADVRPDVAPGAAVVEAASVLGITPQVLSEELVVLPIRGDKGVTDHLAWRFELRDPAQVTHPIVWVDAHSGRVLGWEELVRHATGTVLGEIDDRWPENGLTEAPLRWISLSGQGGNGTSDDVGAFSLSGGTPDTITLQVGSQHFDIDSDTGDTTFAAFHQSEGGDVLMLPDPAGNNAAQRRERAQLDAHVAAHVVRDASLVMNPNFTWADVQVDVNVNIESLPGSNGAGCNAWMEPHPNPNNGNINFLRQGSGCNNTARVADVVYHEYGHGFHFYNVINGAGDFDGAISEGFGDYLSATITGDAAMARGFFAGSSDPLRNIEPNQVWPEDIGEIHYTGLIAAGALWDTRTALMDEYGDFAGDAAADLLYLAATQRASDTPTVYDEVILADDDNGNLADGTPNICLINDAFALHGLGPGVDGSALYAVQLADLPAVVPAEQPIELAVNASIANPQCASGGLTGVRFLWTDGDGGVGSFETASATPDGGDSFSTLLPGQDAGTLVRYRVEVLGDGGEVVATSPSGSVTDPWHATFVGGEVVYSEDFEGGDGGFEGVLLEGPDQEGANDWMWEPPKGGGGDPESGASGFFAWGNDLQPEPNWNGLYQGNVRSYLASPPLPAEGERVFLQFNRWLTVEDGFWDHAFVEVNGTRIWENFAGPNQNDSSNHHEDREWVFRSYEVTDLVEDGQIEVEWHLESDGGLELGGWTVDDVQVVTLGEFVPGDDDDSVGDDDDAAGDDDDGGNGGGGRASFAGNGCTCSTTEPATGSLLALGLLGFGLVGLRRRRG